MATGKKPFTGNNSLMTLDAVLHSKPMPPRELNPKIPIELEGIIGKAMEKDRKHRYQSATEMRSDLAMLKREAESGTIKPASSTAMLRAASRTFGGGSRMLKYALLGTAALLITVLAAVGAWWFKHRETASAEVRNAIAVLPLQNLNGDVNVDYLRFALADELSRVLTYSRSLEVRPSSVTRKFVSPDLDPKKGGTGTAGWAASARALHEAGRPVDRDAGGDRRFYRPLAMARQRYGKSRRHDRTAGGIDHTGATRSIADSGRRGRGSRGDRIAAQKSAGVRLLFAQRRCAARSGPNKEAIKMLEWAVGIDPTYAPAWEALGQRYYFDSLFGGGGETMFQRSNSAYERAVTLDPSRVMAASLLITNRVERGELGRAYDAATDLVQHGVRESADAHFALS